MRTKDVFVLVGLLGSILLSGTVIYMGHRPFMPYSILYFAIAYSVNDWD